VDAAANAVRALRCGSAKSSFEVLLKDARGVLVIPKLVQASLVCLGGKGGDGVICARGKDGAFSAPAFYSLVEVTAGLALGYRQSSYVVLFMNDAVLEKAMAGGFTLGAGATATAGVRGTSAEMRLAGANRDIRYFSEQKGLHAGAGLEGGGLEVREDRNASYYGGETSAKDVLVKRLRDSHTASRALREALAR
jgi:lipid-binding SYLF domain-containing protein